MSTLPAHWLLTWGWGTEDAQSCYILYHIVNYCYLSVTRVWTTLGRHKCRQQLVAIDVDCTMHLGSVLLFFLVTAVELLLLVVHIVQYL